MKVCVFGDWHANTKWALYALDSAPENARLLHAGDFAFDFNRTFITELHNWLEDHGTEIWAIPGNHDDYDCIEGLELDSRGLQVVTSRIYMIPRGYRWEWDGVSFIGLGGAVSIDRDYRTPNYSWWRQEEITQEDVERCSPADVMICHDVTSEAHPPMPDLTLPEDIERDVESHRELMRRATDRIKPKLIIHGHYHVAYEEVLDETIVIGLDCDGKSIYANAMEFDTAELKE